MTGTVNHVGLPVTQVIPIAKLDLEHDAQPIAAILASPEHGDARNIFLHHGFWDDAIVSRDGLSILYALVRNLRPNNVVEIGSFKGKTAFALAHALHANGHGIVHTIGPFDNDKFTPLFEQWPAPLRGLTRFYHMNSAAFFMEAERQRMEFDLVFVDGNHDYEFCLFDIQCAARRLSRNGFIVIDNISQAGPLCATLDFLKSNPDWADCGVLPTPSYPTNPFDPNRISITGTDFMVIRAPRFYSIGLTPQTYGDIPWKQNVVSGVTIHLYDASEGTLFTQWVLRSFGERGPFEVMNSTCYNVRPDERDLTISLPQILEVTSNDHYSVEVWFSWRGPGKLRLEQLPEPTMNSNLEMKAVASIPSGSESVSTSPSAPKMRRNIAMNDLEQYRDIFHGISPWSGYVPHRFTVDFVGMLIDIDFRPFLFTDPNFDGDAVGNAFEQSSLPDLGKVTTPGDAEAWFEAVDLVEAARDARDRYVMITLGANYGAQAVGACRALQTINPMPYKLVAVEPVPANRLWIEQHMRNNGIDPTQQWIVPLAISDTIEPLYFPIGGPGVGSNNCFSTNEMAARKEYADTFIREGRAEEALRNLLMHNTTGIARDLVPGLNFMAEIKLVSCITLNELLGPFDTIDYLEADIQQSEILVFPPFIDLLRRKVRRIHIGTHGKDVHSALHDLFADSGWEMIFSYEPNGHFESSLGAFETNDGVLTVRNPDL